MIWTLTAACSVTLGKSLFLAGLLFPDLFAEPLRGARRLGPLLFLRLLDMVKKKKIKMCRNSITEMVVVCLIHIDKRPL